MNNKIGLIKYAKDNFQKNQHIFLDHGILILDTKFYEKNNNISNNTEHTTNFFVKGSWDNWNKSYPVYVKTFDHVYDELFVWYIYWGHINFKIGKKYYYKFLDSDKWREPNEYPSNNWVFEDNVWNRYFIANIGNINIEVPSYGSSKCDYYTGIYEHDCMLCNRYLYGSPKSCNSPRKIMIDSLKEIIDESTNSERNEFVKEDLDDFIIYLNRLKEQQFNKN